MITFNVSREIHGWAVRAGDGSMTPYWSRDLAVSRAHALAEAMRRHGQAAMVEVAAEVGEVASFAPRRPAAAGPTGIA